MDINSLRAEVILHNLQTNLANSKGPGVFHDLQNTSLSSVFEILIVIFLFLFVLWVIRIVLNIKHYLREPTVILELTPPANLEKTALTTKQLFKTIHDLTKQRTFKEKVLGRKKSFSFEIVSTKSQGIRYLLRSHPQNVKMLFKHLLSYLPQAKLEEVDDYLPSSTNDLKEYQTKIVEFDLAKHFAYPLEKQNVLDEHDPVAYITGQMTKLAPGELLSYQLILTPTKTRETDKIKQKIIRGEDTLKYLNRVVLPSYLQVFTLMLKSVNLVITPALSTIGWAMKTLINDASDPYLARRQMQLQYQGQYLMNSVIANQKPARVLTTFEQEAVKSIEEKIDQKLFQTRIRLFIVVKDKQNAIEREQGFISSLSVFSGLNEQSLVKKFHLPIVIFQKYLYLNFRKRLLSFVFSSSPTLLSISEVSDLYHFPFTKVTQTENIVKVHSKELPAPLSQKQGVKFDILLGNNSYGGEVTPIGLSFRKREKHQYVLGGTGMGKSTLLLYQVTQDIKNGKGVCFIDPHGDTAKAIIPFIPKDREKDFIYFDPDDLKYPININLLELTDGLSEDDALREKQFKMEAVVSLFHKSFSNGKDSHRIDYILRNIIQTAFTVKDCTIFTVFKLINNPPFQKEVVGKLKDEDLKDFWKNEFNKAGAWQQVKMVAGVTSKIGRFLFTPSVKRVLEKPNSTIDFDDVLQNGKILICNFSKGNIGEENTELFGTLLLTQLQMAAQKRGRMLEKDRRPFFLYVDEFQTFATPSFVEMLSESRKYKLYLIMAEQSTSQQNDRNLVDITMANVGITICFRSANAKDEEIMLTQFSPYVTRGEIMNLPMYRFYIKISATDPEEPMSGETVVQNIKIDTERMQQLLNLSRKNYAREYKSSSSAVQQPTVITAKKSKTETTEKHINDTKAEGVLPEQKKKS